ncbi:MAG: NAD-dependent epimerase/dehydratase family protein [Solirubrobacterales bacterium]
MATVFVTGASGFVGRRLVRRLVADGHTVRGLARSDESAATVAADGAEPVRGDLDDVEALEAGARDCKFVVHTAAALGASGDWSEFERINVGGTRRVAQAARAGGARRLVHVSTEAVLMAGEPLEWVDETAPLRPDSRAPYAATKAMAEQVVVDENRDGLEAVILRPRFVWGAGDRTLLPQLVEAVCDGGFAWIDGGRQLTTPTHVDNVVEGVVLSAERGAAGEAYFVTDDNPQIFRDFVTRLLRTQGIEPPEREAPSWLVGPVVRALEAAWKRLPLPGAPPLSSIEYWIFSQTQTLDIAKAKRELGYRPVTGLDEGMRELEAAAAIT